MELAAQTVADLLDVAAKHGMLISEARLADGTHVILYPKDQAPKEDPKAPKALPDRFEDLPTPNWHDPSEDLDTEEARKAAQKAQELTDEEVFGAKIPVE